MANPEAQSPTQDRAQCRTYVLDTSVLLSDPGALRRFAEHEVVLPVVVITELEGKRHHPELGYFARSALRMLDELRVLHGRLDAPVPVGDEGGSLRVELNHTDSSSLPSGFRLGDNDTRILAVARNLADEGFDVTLVSKDLPLRIKASAVGLAAEEYRGETFGDSDTGYSGMSELEVAADSLDELYDDGTLDLAEARDLPCNTGLVLLSDRGTALGRVGPDKQVHLVRGDREAFGLHGRSAEQRIALDLLHDARLFRLLIPRSYDGEEVVGWAAVAPRSETRKSWPTTCGSSSIRKVPYRFPPDSCTVLTEVRLAPPRSRCVVPRRKESSFEASKLSFRELLASITDSPSQEMPRLPAPNTVPVASPAMEVLPAFTQLQLDSVGAALTNPDPAGVLDVLNRMLTGGEGVTLASGIVARFEPTTRRLSWAQAGHPAPLLLRSHDVQRLDRPEGPILGAVRGAVYATARMLLAPGDTVLMFTDGLIERRPSAGATWVANGLETNTSMKAKNTITVASTGTTTASTFACSK
mgnify:CR=1 FL=1